jgi:hypothetical protein
MHSGRELGLSAPIPVISATSGTKTPNSIHSSSPSQAAGAARRRHAVETVGERSSQVGSVLCMRMVFVVAVATVVLLAGCVGPAPTPTPTEAVSEPVFASEEEALAAAEAVFAKYVEAASAVANSGGADMSPFDGLLTEKQMTDETAFAEKLRSEGRVLVGSYTFEQFKGQQVDIQSPEGVYVQAYACLDFSTSHFEVNGEPVDDQDNRDVVPIETVLVASPGSPELRIDGLETWTGENFCS